jgi:hypothetical protein
LTHYDDFEKSVPYLVERTKIKMADQDIDFFYYPDETLRPPLLNKHLLIESKHEKYEKQKSFDKRLSKLLGIPSTGEINLHRQVFEERLVLAKKQVFGFKLICR